jgi:hypothetical protein
MTGFGLWKYHRFYRGGGWGGGLHITMPAKKQTQIPTSHQMHGLYTRFRCALNSKEAGRLGEATACGAYSRVSIHLEPRYSAQRVLGTREALRHSDEV